MLCTSYLELTVYRKLFSVVTLLQTKDIPVFRLSLLCLLTSTLPGYSASEVTTLWRYTNLYYYYYIIIIIVILAHQHKAVGRKTTLDIQNYAATVIYSVTMVLWKETAFPLWRAMERRWKRNVCACQCVSSMGEPSHAMYQLSLLLLRLCMEDRGAAQIRRRSRRRLWKNRS